MQLSKSDKVKLAAVASSAVGVLWVLWRRASRNARLPPGSYGLPFLGEMLEWIRGPHEFIEKRLQKYGGTFKTHVNLTPVVILQPTPENLKKFYSVKGVGWPSHWNDVLGHSALPMVNDPAHKQLRVMASRAFTQAQLDSYLPVLQDYTQEHLSKWAEGEEVGDMFMPIKVYTFDMAQRVIFGERFSEDTSRRCSKLFADATKGLEIMLPYHYPGSPWTKSQKARADLMQIYQQIIDKRRAAKAAGELSPKGNLIDAMLSGDGSEGGEPTDVELQDQCFAMAFAGHDTTLATIQDVLYYLKAMPGLEDRLRAEVDASWDGKAPITREIMQKVPQCRAFLLEVLQFLPPVAAAFRVSLEDMTFDGYTVPAGMTMAIGSGSVPRQFFGTAAQEFNIDRHIDVKGQYVERVYDTASFGSFGGGSRMCIGYKFSMDELTVFLLVLLRRFEFRSEPIGSVTFPFIHWKIKASFKERIPHASQSPGA